MDLGTTALIVIDMQQGFLNANSQHVVPAVTDLVDQWKRVHRPVVFTKYHNSPGSSFERLLHWSRLQRPPETDFAPELAQRVTTAAAVLEKTTYTCFTDEGIALFEEHRWTDLIFCGVATESCVLKSAVDAFELGLTPWIITDASASDAGAAVHEAGITVARRFIGAGQLITCHDLRYKLDQHTDAQREK